MVKVKSREEVIVIIQQIEECQTLEALQLLVEKHGTAPDMLRKAFSRRIRQLISGTIIQLDRQ